MSGRCKDCKWWGGCHWMANADGDDFKGCSNPKLQDEDHSPDGIMLHKSIDTSVMTGPDFGCIHHERKVEL